MDHNPGGSSVEPILIEPEENPDGGFTISSNPDIANDEVPDGVYKCVNVQMNGVVKSLHIPIVPAKLPEKVPISPSVANSIAQSHSSVGRQKVGLGTVSGVSVTSGLYMTTDSTSRVFTTKTNPMPQLVIRKPAPSSQVVHLTTGNRSQMEYNSVQLIDGISMLRPPPTQKSVLVPVQLRNSGQTVLQMATPNSVSTSRSGMGQTVLQVATPNSVSNSRSGMGQTVLQVATPSSVSNSRSGMGQTVLQMATPNSVSNSRSGMGQTVLQVATPSSVSNSRSGTIQKAGLAESRFSTAQTNPLNQVTMEDLLAKYGQVAVINQPVPNVSVSEAQKQNKPTSSVTSPSTIIIPSAPAQRRVILPHTQTTAVATTMSNPVQAQFSLASQKGETPHVIMISQNQATKSVKQLLNERVRHQYQRMPVSHMSQVGPSARIPQTAPTGQGIIRAISANQVETHPRLTRVLNRSDVMLARAPNQVLSSKTILNAHDLVRMSNQRAKAPPTKTIFPWQIAKQTVQGVINQGPLASNQWTLNDRSGVTVLNQASLNSVLNSAGQGGPIPVSSVISNRLRGNHSFSFEGQQPPGQVLGPVTGICVNQGAMQSLQTPMYISSGGVPTSGESHAPGIVNNKPSDQLLAFYNGIVPEAPICGRPAKKLWRGAMSKDKIKVSASGKRKVGKSADPPAYSNASNTEKDTLNTILMGLYNKQLDNKQPNVEGHTIRHDGSREGRGSDLDIEVLETIQDDQCFIDHVDNRLPGGHRGDISVKTEGSSADGTEQQHNNSGAMVIKSEPVDESDPVAVQENQSHITPKEPTDDASAISSVKNESSLKIDSVTGTAVKADTSTVPGEIGVITSPGGSSTQPLLQSADTKDFRHLSDTDSVDIDIEDTDSADSDADHRQRAMDVMFDKLAEFHKHLPTDEQPNRKDGNRRRQSLPPQADTVSRQSKSKAAVYDLFMRHHEGRDNELLSNEASHEKRKSKGSSSKGHYGNFDYIPQEDLRSLEDEIKEIRKNATSQSAENTKEFGRQGNKSSRILQRSQKPGSSKSACGHHNCFACEDDGKHKTHKHKTSPNTYKGKDKRKIKGLFARGKLPKLYQVLFNNELLNIYRQRYPQYRLKNCSIMAHRLPDRIRRLKSIRPSGYVLENGKLIDKKTVKAKSGKEKYLMMTTTRGTFLLPVDGDFNKPALVLTNDPVSGTNKDGKVNVRVIRDWKPDGVNDPTIWKQVLEEAAAKSKGSPVKASQKPALTPPGPLSPVAAPATERLQFSTPPQVSLLRPDIVSPQSEIGYTPPSILSSHQPVPQQLFMVDKNSGITPVVPINVNEDQDTDSPQTSVATNKRPLAEPADTDSVKRMKSEHDVLQSLDNIPQNVVDLDDEPDQIAMARLSSADRIKELKERFKLMSEKAIGETRVALEKSKDVLREMDMA